MSTATTRNRIGQYFRKCGLRRLVWRAVIETALRFRSAWRRLTCHRNHVFVHEGPVGCVELPPGLSVARFASWEDITREVQAGLLEYGGARHVANIRREMVDRAVLWIGLIAGQIVCVQMTRAGRDIAKWFVPLRDDDIIVFAVGTRMEYRGSGIAPAIIRHAMHRELGDNGKAHIDCKVWNKPAIRGFEKAGFRWIATMRPLPDPRGRQ